MDGNEQPYAQNIKVYHVITHGPSSKKLIN